MDREKVYEENGKGSYLLFFQYRKKMAIDATAKDGSFGRLINHSTKEANLVMKVIAVAGTPRVVFLASKEIPIGSELLYDYGERRKAIVDQR